MADTNDQPEKKIEKEPTTVATMTEAADTGKGEPSTWKAHERPRGYSLDEVWQLVKTPAEGDFRIGKLSFRKYTRKEAESGTRRSENAVVNSDEANKRRKINMGEVWKPVKVPAEGDFQIGGMWFRKSSNDGSFSQTESQLEPSSEAEAVVEASAEECDAEETRLISNLVI
ncbi:hypothetical protein CAEBREN_23245 [Caenorhabditis brenneri]|uniref:Uncharacterized protein n=1 Tax=Caenorhabditis brenneri TaxID=135651 RepID=G0N835_CAEBE|nr:hypothetical protein CAEBREN_23245 [Caenorhabditis brenneri]